MKITFALKEFFNNDKKANARQVNHFLLRNARVEVTLVFEDSSQKSFAPPRDPNGRFILDLEPNDIPEAGGPGIVGEKKRITRLALDFWVDLTAKGTTFQLLKIRQDFWLTPLPTNTDQNIDYALSPFSWTHSATSAMRTANANVHPLLDLRKLRQNLVLMNALVLDITELWNVLNETNENYQFYREVSPPEKVTFKAFAHLGGNAFIWYGVVPSSLAKSTKVSPHVFYFAGDYGSKQNLLNEENYLFDNPAQLESRALTESEEKERFSRRRRRLPDELAPNNAFNGKTLLLGYLLPPVDDDKIQGMMPRIMEKGRFESILESRRNVVNFERSNDDPRQIALQHWNIGAGLERAFYGLGKSKPQQFLLLPQDFGTDSQSVKGLERERHLKAVTDAIFDVLQTNTELISHSKDELVEKDKMILSGFSESGLDLWRSCKNNINHIKAIIGIEPNQVNPKGKAVIPDLLKKKIKIFIIGRHRGGKGGKDHFRPDISKDLQKQIRFLPDDLKILAYPPDPDSNDFVKFRVARVTDPNLDPLMLDGEKEILADFATRPKPITGKAVIPHIFSQPSNRDSRAFGSVDGVMYTHNFAFTGGQDLTLADPNHFYLKPVSYRTFFQQAVEEIG